MNRRAWVLPALMLTGGVGGVILGATFGSRWREPAMEPLVLGTRALGTVFLALLKALMIPLIVTSVVTAMQGLGRASNAGRVAAFTGGYYLFTTLVAVLTGVALVLLLHPGQTGAALSAGTASVAPPTPTISRALYDVVTGMVPDNIVGAAASGNMLGLLVLSLVFGVALAHGGEQAVPLVQALAAANETLFKVVHWVVRLAPLGIFGLVADRMATAGGGSAAWLELQRVGMYSATVLIGLAVHSLLTLPLLLVATTGRNPFRYLAGMAEALITAAGTASSAATLGVTLRCAVERNHVSVRAADFVIPIGTTVNMNGTALYEAVAVVFLAQTMGLDLSGTQLAVVVLTATLAAVGAAAIPEAGLVTMVLVLTAVGLPADGVGLVLAVDWVLDRFRTAVNVWGDAVGAAVIEPRLVD